MLALSCFSLAGCSKVEERPAVAFSPGRAAGESAPLTIVLPAGWTYAAGEQESARVQKYVFTGSSKAFPYLWVVVEPCTTEELAARRKKAAERESRKFLSGGDLSTDYYDSSRKLQWNRVKDEFGNGSVTAVVYDKHQVMLKFADDRAHLDEFEPVILAVVDNMQIHELEEKVAASNEVVELPSDVSPEVFHRATAPKRFPYLILIATVTVVAILARVEYVIRQKRYAEQIAEAERRIGDRKQQEAALRKAQNAAAAQYLRDIPKSHRR